MASIYNIEFTPMWPVPSGLVILAENENSAKARALEILDRGGLEFISIEKIDTTGFDIQGNAEPVVLFYESGDY